MSANKHSGSDPNLSSHTNLPCENSCFVELSVSMRQKDIGILKMRSPRYVAKKWIDEVTKSTMFNGASLESKKFHVKDKFKLQSLRNVRKVDGIFQPNQV